MFDILDDNQNFNSLSTFPNRSASMRKVSKKENTASFPQSNLSSFDQLINGFLDKSTAKPLQNSENLVRSTAKKDNLDIFDLNLGSNTNPKTSIPLNVSSPTSSVRLPNYSEQLNTHFGQTQKTIVNASKIQESFVSSRNMKPPIKRRENYSYITNNIFNSDLGAAIPEEDPNLTNSSNKLQEDYSYKGGKRRSSIDARSEIGQINVDQSFASKRDIYSSNNHQDKVKEEPLQKLANTQSHIIDWKAKSLKAGSRASPTHTPTISEQLPVDRERQICQRIEKSNKTLIEDYERQINLIKESHQRHLSFLQEQLNKQILQNKQMRQNFMKETAKIIDEQRERSKNIHNEEVNRLKDMFQWQKKKISDAYKCQIESLKSINSYQQKIEGKPLQIDRFQQENTEVKLKLWQASLKEKEISLDRRELEISQRISQINIQKRHDDERLRNQQKRLIEMQMGIKKQIMAQKQSLSQQKHRISSQMGEIQLQILKQREFNQLTSKQIELQRESLEKQKSQLRKISNQVMNSHKVNLEQIQHQKQRLAQLQHQLIKKIRTVEMKAKELSHHRNNDEQNYCITHQKPTYVLENDRSRNLVRPLSRDMNSKSMASLLKTKQTKDRFFQMQQNHRHNLNSSIKQNRKLDLSHYMQKIQRHTKNRQ